MPDLEPPAPTLVPSADADPSLRHVPAPTLAPPTLAPPTLASSTFLPPADATGLGGLPTAGHRRRARHGVTRRAFVATTAAGGAVAALDATVPGVHLHPVAAFERLFDVTTGPVVGIDRPTVTATLVRKEDLLRLSIDFYGVRLDTSDPDAPTLVRQSSQTEPIAVVRFPPQHLLETAVPEPLPSGQTPPPVPLPTRLAGESRLAFTLPDAVFPLPYTTASLLGWVRWTPRLVPAAGHPTSTVRLPTNKETALEVPFWVLMSPGPGNTWRHHGLRPPGVLTVVETLPVTLDGRTDLWQTTLDAPRVVTGTGAATILLPKGLRAVWHLNPNRGPNDDALETAKDVPFVQPLQPVDWHDLVLLTSRTAHGSPARPLDVDRLSLSPLGASLDVTGTWDTTTKSSLTHFEQQTSAGRDEYVEVIHAGFLYPFGVPAAHVEVSVRELATPEAPNGTVAYVRKHSFLAFGDQVHDLATGFAQTTHGANRMPFTSIRTAKHRSPDLLPPQDFGGVSSTLAFVPKRPDGSPLEVHLIGTDWAGQDVAFTSPVVFVDSVAATTSGVGVVQRVRDEWDGNGPTAVARRTAKLQGAEVTFAPSTTDGDTRHEVSTMSFTSHGIQGSPSAGDLLAHHTPRWYPQLTSARIRLQAAEEMSGRSLGGVDVHYLDHYVTNGFGSANPGQVYLATTTPPTLRFAGDHCGAVVHPNLVVSAVSRVNGPVGGDPQSVAQHGRFDAASFFHDATLLGTVDLADIIDDDNGNASLTSAPAIASSRAGGIQTTTLHFEIATKEDGTAPDGTSYFVPGDSGSPLVLDARVVTDLAHPEQRRTTVDGTLTDFTMWLLGSGSLAFVELHFSQLSFHSENGQDPTLTPTVDKTDFHGVMEFIADLAQYLSFGGDGLAIDTEPTQLTISLSFSLPSIGLGVFSLENIAFGASLVLPFTGESARLAFNFCSADAPFHLTIAFFGGGGWFELELTLDHVSHLEIGLEFGASASIDLGVASGEVHIWAGVYFSLDVNDDGDSHVVLTGYVRAGGSVSVLCIASISLEAYIGFTYDDDNGTTKVGGEASLTLTVSVLCFSVSVSADWQQYFGGEGDPVFSDFYPPDPDEHGEPVPLESSTSRSWDDFCLAFAAPTPVDVHVS